MPRDLKGGEIMKNEQEYKRIINEANEAKDRLYQVANELEQLGYIRKAKSCMTLIYKIEEWQNKQ